MLILGLLGMYFDATLVFVTSQTLLLRLALAILCFRCFKSYDPKRKSTKKQKNIKEQIRYMTAIENEGGIKKEKYIGERK